jgi:hypothetical protein
VWFLGLRNDVKDALNTMKYFGPRIGASRKYAIPLKQFSKDEAIEFSEYTKRHLIRKDMPRLTYSLQSKILEALDELFANSALHSQTKTPIAFAGRYSASRGRVSLALADGGRTIQGAIADALHQKMDAVDAIHWAMEPANTTRRGDIPGGLGSRILREFVSRNRGRLIVVSHDGFWLQDGDIITKLRLGASFPGTCVILHIDASDTRSYEPQSLELNEIW